MMCLISLNLQEETPLAQNILIIGSSIAGLSAAQAARDQDPDCILTVLSEDSHLPYFRQRLSEVLENREQAGKLFLHTDSWYQDMGIQMMLNSRVVSVDTKDKTVTLESGQALPYDKLIIASGSASMVPPIPGSGLPGVETLWTMEDALRIEARIQNAKRSIVIGGGLLGLEAAHAFHQRGLTSLILERLPRLMMRQLDERSAQLFTAQVEKSGTSVTTDAYVKEIYADPLGKAAGVTLQDGTQFPADLIFISAGVKARLEFLEGSGIECDRHIKVDEYLRTNVPDVYAAGDCASLNGRWHGLWMVARQQGAAAGANAAGANAPYDMPVPPYMIKTMGTQIASAGTIEENTLSKEALEQLHADIMVNNRDFQYAKKLYVGDTLSGFILMGDTKAFSSLNKSLGQPPQ